MYPGSLLLEIPLEKTFGLCFTLTFTFYSSSLSMILICMVWVSSQSLRLNMKTNYICMLFFLSSSHLPAWLCQCVNPDLSQLQPSWCFNYCVDWVEWISSVGPSQPGGGGMWFSPKWLHSLTSSPQENRERRGRRIPILCWYSWGNAVFLCQTEIVFILEHKYPELQYMAHLWKDLKRLGRAFPLCCFSTSSECSNVH